VKSLTFLFIRHLFHYKLLNRSSKINFKEQTCWRFNKW